MSNVLIDDGDPRKKSAKKIKKAMEKELRGAGGWLADFIIKSLLVSIALILDFTLFANAGSYNMFAGYGVVNLEILFIIVGIIVFSSLLVLSSMIIRPLENVILAAILALTGIAIINQFATFDKQSALIMLLGNWFSEDMNAILYKYSLWIITGTLFLIFYILIKLSSRTTLFYSVIILGGLEAWILVEAYLAPSQQLFKPLWNVSSDNSDKKDESNLVFITLRDFPSLNSLINYNKNQSGPISEKGLHNALGFLYQNNFTVYPNAIVQRDAGVIDNMMQFYNFNNNKDAPIDNHSVVMQNGFFDFTILHPATDYLVENSLFDDLKKQGYNLNVYQLNGLDICRSDNQNKISACFEKVNYPAVLPSEQFSATNKAIFLSAQWLHSTGMVDNINLLLSTIHYIVDYITPYNFYPDKINSLKALNVLDIVLDEMEHKTGKQAYFIDMDFLANTFIYNEYCQIKPLDKWFSNYQVSGSRQTLNSQQSAYIEQMGCLYGSLQRFIKQLENADIANNTTIILIGNNVPSLLNHYNENSLYHRMQAEQQVGLAIKPAGSTGPKIDYRICEAKTILSSFFNDNDKLCRDSEIVKTTPKILAHIKSERDSYKLKGSIIHKAVENFNAWFAQWAKENNYNISQPQPEQDNDIPLELEVVTKTTDKTDTATEEAPVKESEAMKEENLEEAPSYQEDVDLNISATVNEDAQVNQSDEQVVIDVIPETLFDEGMKIDFNEAAAIKNQMEAAQASKAKAADNIAATINNTGNKPATSAQKQPKSSSGVVSNNHSATATAPKEEPQKVMVIRKAFSPNDTAANKQKLSPEELKKQYHETMKQIQNN